MWHGVFGTDVLFCPDYDLSFHDRLEMGVTLADQTWEDADLALPEGLEARALDIHNDDLIKVFDVLKMVREHTRRLSHRGSARLTDPLSLACYVIRHSVHSLPLSRRGRCRTLSIRASPPNCAPSCGRATKW